MQRIVKLSFLFILISVGLCAEEFRGVRSVALSGALRGQMSLNAGIYHNPAAFAFSQKYSVEALSSVLPSHGNQPRAMWIVGGSVVDSYNPYLSGGFAYYNRSTEVLHRGELKKRTDNVYHLALSRSVSKFFALGITGKYGHQSRPEGNQQFGDVDVGGFVLIGPQIQAGLVGHNLLASHEDFPREIGWGVRARVWEFLYMNVDVVKGLSKPLTQDLSLLTAMEVIHNNGVSFQAGLSLSDQKERNHYSLGIGWAQHKVGVSYGFQNSWDGLSRQTHALSLRVFF